MTAELIPAQDIHALTVALNVSQIGELHNKLDDAVLSMDRALEYLQRISGPTPGPVAAQLMAHMNFCCGHYRHCRDTLRRLYRARNTAMAQERVNDL